MATKLQRALLPTLAVLLLWLGSSFPWVDRADAKGLGVEPRVGAPGTAVTLQTLFPGAPPDHDVTLSLVPQGTPGADCSTVLATAKPTVAEGVSPTSWELSGTVTIPAALTCGSERRPVEPGMYWIEVGGVQIDAPGSDVDLSRVQFGVPDFIAGSLGAGFSSYVVLDTSTVTALEARFPGELLGQNDMRQQLAAPFILTLICRTGCYEDPLAGQDNTHTIQAFYYRYLHAEGAIISFDPDGPFYELDQTVARALSASVGPVQPATNEQPASLMESSLETRDRTPFVIAAVAGGLSFALVAFVVGELLGRRGRRGTVA